MHFRKLKHYTPDICCMELFETHKGASPAHASKSPPVTAIACPANPNGCKHHAEKQMRFQSTPRQSIAARGCLRGRTIFPTLSQLNRQMKLGFTIFLETFGSGAKMRGLIRKQMDRLHVSCGAVHGVMGSPQQHAIFAVAFLREIATLHLDFELPWMRSCQIRLADDHPHINSIPLLSLLC